jgi:hypothetical protein
MSLSEEDYQADPPYFFAVMFGGIYIDYFMSSQEAFRACREKSSIVSIAGPFVVRIKNRALRPEETEDR